MAEGMSEGLAWLMVSGVLFVIMGALMLALVVVRGRAARRTSRAALRRADAQAVRAQAQHDRAHAAVMRAQRALDRSHQQAGRRSRKGAPWSSTGMNALLLLLLLAPYADRLTLSV